MYRCRYTHHEEKTYEVARASAETALTGAALLREGREQTVYTLCRPSGHHAGPRLFGGYCYFNNVATAAEYLLPEGRVAIVDIDYHHGNGTQEFFNEINSVFTASIHGDPDDANTLIFGAMPTKKEKARARERITTNHYRRVHNWRNTVRRWLGFSI